MVLRQARPPHTRSPDAAESRPQLGLKSHRRSDIGPVAVTVLVVAVAAIGVAVVLSSAIPRIVESRLLDATALSIQRATDTIAADLDPGDTVLSADLDVLATRIEHDLLGRDLVRVKIWNDAGVIVYSDEPRLTGQQFEMSDDVLAAFRGDLIHDEPDMARPENRYERDLGQLREYYIPVDTGDQGVDAVFEVYERAAALEETIATIAGAVRIALGAGAALLLGALGIAAVANARAVRRRQARSERLLRQLIDAQDSEWTRIVGALHDDIGQPLYRVMFGLQTSIAMADDSVLRDELEQIDGLIRSVDSTLRNQLTQLRDEPGAEVDLVNAITELAEVIEHETGLDIACTTDIETVPPLEHRVLLYRATREALENVRRHAHASSITLTLLEGATDTMVEVVDDGVGMTGPAGLGLATLQDRLEAIGGGLLLEGAHGGGVRFVAWVPNQAVVEA